jgi:hypothetical protein
VLVSVCVGEYVVVAVCVEVPVHSYSHRSPPEASID